jgi:hypothetical protein
MVRRSDTSRHSRSAAAAEPIFVDRSGRRLRRLRLFGGVTLVGVAVYIAMIATAFFGGSDVSMPFLPQFAARSDDASRPLPANAPAPDPVQPVPAAPDQPAASESPSEPAPSEPTPAPTAAPAEPTADAPGRSETAPGQTNPAEPPAPQHP